MVSFQPPAGARPVMAPGGGRGPAAPWEPSLPKGDTEPLSPINSTRSMVPRSVEAEGLVLGGMVLKAAQPGSILFLLSHQGHV